MADKETTDLEAKDKTKNQKSGAPATEDMLSITSVPKRFCRCGYFFSQEPTVLRLADLKPDVVKRLEDEPNLRVVKSQALAVADKASETK